MSAHTKEPWVAVEGIIYPSNGREDGEDWIADLRSAGNTDANERRIVACVNACAGLDSELLENIDITGGLVERFALLNQTERQRDEALAKCVRLERELDRANGFHERLAEQRDELLAALKGMVEVAEFGLTLFGNTTPPDADGPLIQARAAIAKVEGKA
jgi:hypothetical protein